MVYRCCFVLVLVVLLSGCSQSTPPTASAPAPVKPVATEDSAATTAMSDDDGPDAAPANSVVANEEEPAEAGDAKPSMNQVMQLVQGRKFGKALEAAQAAQELDPKNRQLVLVIIQLNQLLAAEQIEAGKDAAASSYLIDSAKAARRLVAEFAPLEEEEQQMLAQVIYNEAGMLAKDKQTEAAIKSLSEVLGYGFENLAELDADKDFDSIREEEAFKEWRASAGEKIAEHMKKKTIEELAANKPFDFDFTLNDPAGKAHKLADLKGKIVLVDVWGTWCPPCRKEIPHLIAVHKKYQEQGVEVVGLNYEGGTPDEDGAKVTEFVKENGVTYPCLLGDDATKDQIPDFQGFPTMLFIDRAGKVRLKHVGYTPQAGLEAVIEALLAEKVEEK